MFIELIADHGGYSKGDVLDVAEPIGRAYIDAGQAKASDAATHMKKLVAAEIERSKAEFQETARTLLAEGRSAKPNPPGGGLEIESISNTSTTPLDNAEKSFGDIVRLMYLERYGEGPARTWASGRIHKVYQLERTMISGSGLPGVQRGTTESSDGAQTAGYLVRPTYAPSIFKIAPEEAIFGGTFTVPTGKGVEVRHPALDQYGANDGKNLPSYGGVKLYRRTENQARIASRAEFSEVEFRVTDLTGLSVYSRDFLDDAFISADSYINEIYADAFSARRDVDFLFGSGVGEPQGALNPANPALLTRFRKTLNKIVFEDLVGMLSRLAPAARAGAVWLINPTALEQLIAVKDNAGNYVFQPNSLVSQGQLPSLLAGNLLGIPVKISEKIPVVGETSDISLISTRHYGEAMRQGIEVGFSSDAYFETDEVGVRWKLRNDGRSMWKSTYKMGKSNVEISPFITLAATTS